MSDYFYSFETCFTNNTDNLEIDFFSWDVLIYMVECLKKIANEENQ